MKEEILYHYTDLSAFENIIKSGELWFTQVGCLNDYTEYIYYNNVLEQARANFLSNNIINHTFDESILTSYIDKNFIDPRDSYYKKTFTLSLTNLDDSIPMWNYYAKKIGIAIGFNKDALMQKIKNKVDEYYAFSEGEIIYNKKDQFLGIDVALKMINDIINNSDLLKKDIEVQLTDIKKMLGLMWAQSHLYKDESFSYEKESRVTLCKLDIKKEDEQLDKIYSIITDNNTKSVIKINLTNNWNDIITNVIISPYNNISNIKQNILSFLRKNEILINEENIQLSKCPIR